MSYKLAQASVLLSLISSTKGSFTRSNVPLNNPAALSSLMALYVCRARSASWYARISMCPPELQASCGILQPSPSHARRLCKLLNSEWWNQVRFFKDCLWVSCGLQADDRRSSHQRFSEWMKVSRQLTEWLWNQVRLKLPAKKKPRLEEGTLMNLTNLCIPPHHESLLRNGPKFNVATSPPATELLAMSRRIASRVQEESKPVCVAECVEALSKGACRPSGNRQIGRVVDFLSSSGLTAVVSDKEGFFVIMSEGMFSEKGGSAIDKNFRLVGQKPEQVRADAVKLLRKHSLDKLAGQVKTSKGLLLSVFFNAKTHKDGIPFRTIVSERNTWLHLLSGFLQSHLQGLDVHDPFVIPSSDSVVQFLRNENPVGCKAFSIDVEDLYYAMPQDALLRSVKECICDLNDEVAFTHVVVFRSKAFWNC
uniref:Tick transposon n=1 Tax=Rhipicephalus pulchellus TaxID=72859 RepID=L7LXN4_RHIPC